MTKAGKPIAVDYGVAPGAGGFIVMRNGAPLKTPGGVAYGLPKAALAEAVAAEWRAQTGKPNPTAMPITQLAATALDIMPQKRAAVVEGLAAYAATELLCHRADFPAALAQRQQETWQPLLDWCALRFDALLRTGAGIMPISQPPEALKALRHAIASYDDFALSGLSAAVDACGSLVLGLALAERHQTASAIFRAAELDSSYQMDRWGADAEMMGRHESLRRELENCERWFGFLAG